MYLIITVNTCYLAIKKPRIDASVILVTFAFHRAFIWLKQGNCPINTIRINNEEEQSLVHYDNASVYMDDVFISMHNE